MRDRFIVVVRSTTAVLVDASTFAQAERIALATTRGDNREVVSVHRAYLDDPERQPETGPDQGAG